MVLPDCTHGFPYHLLLTCFFHFCAGTQPLRSSVFFNISISFMNNLARLDCFCFWKENKLCHLKEIVLTDFRRVFRICLFSLNNPCRLYLSHFSISHRGNKEICCNLNKYNNNTTTTTSTFFSFLPQVQHPDQDLDSLLQ